MNRIFDTKNFVEPEIAFNLKTYKPWNRQLLKPTGYYYYYL
ncbi:MAG: hypothetical protein JWM28_735 [Chitinophagaceae bacterium]|nr:hypothetical protein [Chitinophagaceae bacterium]